MKYAILLDAGFLKRRLGSSTDPVTAKRVVEFTETIAKRKELENHTLHRIYYYDAEPMKGIKPIPLTGSAGNWSRHDFSKTPEYSANKTLLNDLRKEPFFAIRLGELTFRGWLVRPNKLKAGGNRTSLNIESGDLKPNVQQKGVDLRIGLDIAALALKHHVEIIALVAGDSDFIPALKFARREGKQVFLYSLGLGQNIHPDLCEHADLWIDESFENLQSDATLEKGIDET